MHCRICITVQDIVNFVLTECIQRGRAILGWGPRVVESNDRYSTTMIRECDETFRQRAALSVVCEI